MHWKRDITYSGWGRAHSTRGDLARPGITDPLESSAPAIGNRRSYGDAPLNSGGRAIDMTARDQILSFDKQTGLLKAQAGVTIGTLARVLPRQGWIPAVMPGTGFATIGGAIGMDVHGKNHHNTGSFCQHLTEITLHQNGAQRVITPADTGLWAATCGGLGQTGIILDATLQLRPCKGDIMVVTERRARNWDEHIALLDQSEATYTVGWIDATAKGASLGRGILEEAETGPGLVPPPAKRKSIPMNAPHWALSSPIVRAFNALYYRRVPPRGRTVVRAIEDFFFPLDKILEWNKLYGRRGFHQFQCVVPLDQVAALRDIMAKITESGLASPLAVLKRMGEGRSGYLSFPMPGYTLAVDFPNRPEARDLIGRLETATLDAKGRIYLAKDGLARSDSIRAMYPDHPKWAAEVAKVDPDGHLMTDLVRRLNLRNT